MINSSTTLPASLTHLKETYSRLSSLKFPNLLYFSGSQVAAGAASERRSGAAPTSDRASSKPALKEPHHWQKPVSHAGGTSQPMYPPKGKEPCEAAVRGMRKMSKTTLQTARSEKEEGQVVFPGTEMEIALKPMENPMAGQVDML